MFNLTLDNNTAWLHLEASFRFSDIAPVTTYSSLCTAAILLGYRSSLDALVDANLDAIQQSSILEYMRYLNAIIQSIPNGRFVENNPKLFLANLGINAGRPLALTPTIPLRVRNNLVKILSRFNKVVDVDDPPLPQTPEIFQNVIAERVEILKLSASLSESMVMCSCGMGFFG